MGVQALEHWSGCALCKHSVVTHRQRTFVGTVTKWVKYGSTTVYELDGNIDYWQVLLCIGGSGTAGAQW